MSKPVPPPRQHLPVIKPSPSYQSLERALENLSIRNPCELVIGIAKSVVTQWRHKPSKLLRPGICYEAQYLGSTLVRHVRGTESTKRSIQKLKKRNAKDTNKCAGIVLAISLSGVHFLDPFSQVQIIFTTFISIAISIRILNVLRRRFVNTKFVT